MSCLKRTEKGRSLDEPGANALIASPEEGALALVMSIFETAFHDLRLVLSPPEAARLGSRGVPKTPLSIRRTACIWRHRRRAARCAARFLDDADNLYLHWLRSCGVDVPVKRMLSELRKLKAATLNPSPTTQP